MAERPNPELPMPVPVTRHHGLLWFTFALLHRSSAPICTFARSLSCPQVLTSSDYAPSQLSGSPTLPPLSDTVALGRDGSPSRPFADRRANLLYVSKLSVQRRARRATPY
jgi:hypothetical protein